MRPCAALATLSTLVFYSGAGAQDIPAPTADMLPTPEEIRKAPCFPFFDASDPNARHYQLPAEL